MLIAVGSTNPVKIKAVKKVVKKAFGEVKVIGVSVPSGVFSQPRSEAEARRGALNRAKRVLYKAKSDFGVGLEGAIRKIGKYGYFITPWCAVVSKKGDVGFGHGAAPSLPRKLEKELLAGVELATVMDRESGLKNIKHKMGAFGLLTKGIVTRQMAYEQMVAFAFARFIAPEFYDD